MAQRTTHPRKSRLLPLLALTALLTTFFTCADKEEHTTDNNRNLHNTTTSFIYNMIPANTGAGITDDYSKGVNTFSVNLLKTMYADEKFSGKNVVVSPFSLARNLAVLTEGTTGESQQELLDALGGRSALDDARAALSELLYADKSVVLQCADALYFREGVGTLKQSFRNTVNAKYGVEIAGLDFSDVAGTVDTVNSWVCRNTNNHIERVVEARDITNDLLALVLNALYFKADWASPFDITRTEQGDFLTPDGVVQTPMMESEYHHHIRSTDRYINAKLYYGSNSKDYFYLDIYMPTTGSITTFLQEDCRSALSETDSMEYGDLSMPKFFFTTTVDLIPVLQQLGIEGIFDPGQGEITEMFENWGQDVYVSMVRQKAGIKTDEEGTTAYAVTVSAVDVMGIEEAPAVVFDSPFVFFIRAGDKGLVLFEGVVNNPNKTG